MSLLTDASLLVTPNAYKEGKLYSIIPSNGNGDFTVTRATTATRVNSAGLVELVPYNLAQYSEMFNQGVWAKTNVNISANVATAPNGTLTADKMIATSAGSNPFMAQDGISSNGPTTLSVYAKKGELNWLRLSNFSFSYASAWFDLNNGTIGTVSGTAAPTATITDAGNGWYRCTITISVFSSGAASDFVIACTNANNTTTGYTGNNVDGIFIWGAQAVDGILARDYQMTETRLNIPRLDYSLGGSCPNILLEPVRTNVCLWSEQFDNATWTVNGITIDANVTTAPNGVLVADKIKVNSGQAVGSSHIQQIITKAASALAYSCSAYLKASELNSARLFVRDGISALNNANAQFNLSTGVISIAATANGTFSSASATITNVGNGWYRCTLSFTSSTDTTLQLRIGTADTTITTGNGIDGIFGWGAQLELGTYTTSYVPTTSASVTRNGDLISRTNIYTNGLITASGGTWFVELRNNRDLIRDAAANSLFVADSASGATNGFMIRNNLTATGTLKITKRIATAETVLYTTPTGTLKIVIKWDGAAADVFVNGVKVVAATAFTTTNMDFLTASGIDVPKYINEMALFSTPLTDPQCIALTT